MSRAPRRCWLACLVFAALGACAFDGLFAPAGTAAATLQFARTASGQVVAIARTDVDRFVVVVLTPTDAAGHDGELAEFLLARGIGAADATVFAASASAADEPGSIDVGDLEVAVLPAEGDPPRALVELRHRGSRAVLAPAGCAAALVASGDADDADVIGLVAAEERGMLREASALRETWLVVDAVAGDARCLALAERPLFLSLGSGWHPIDPAESAVPAASAQAGSP